MKILHIETGQHLYGGAQQVLWLLAGLRRAGIESPLVCSPASAIAVAAAQNGIPVIPLPCRGDLDLLFARRLGKVLRREGPVLVHCHSRRGADVFGGRAARAAGIPAVVSRRVDNAEARWLARLRYRPYARIIAISEAIAGVLAECGVDRQRVTVIRSAVDAAAFRASPDIAGFRASFGLSEEHQVVVCVAQFIARKGHRFLLQAVAELVPRYPGLRLILFGRGPLEPDLLAQRDQLGLGEAVQFAGFRDDLDRYLGAADLVVQPSLTEGLGVSVLKAAAAGVPVVASDAGGLREAVVDGETGVLVPPGDAPALAAAIAALLDDAPRRRQFAEAGRRRMQAEFSIDAMVEAHLDVYRDLTGLAL